MEHSLGLENVTDPFPAGVIRTALNRNLAACYPDIQDEVVQSFSDVLALDGSGKLRDLGLSSHIYLTLCRLEGRARHEHHVTHCMPREQSAFRRPPALYV
jgi:hypothetical protein